MAIHELRDSFGRRIDYIRVSLNEECNFRCIYCYPFQDSRLRSKQLTEERYLTKDEIINFVKIASHFGVKHLRLTGGEPLLRKEICEIIGEIQKSKLIEDLSITTNASLLGKKILELKDAGLKRINISLDSLNKERFKKITGSNSFDSVMDSIYCAIELGFRIKLNMVAMSDITVDEILQFVRLGFENDIEVRFIEFMPLCGKSWRQELAIPIGKIKELILNHFELTKIDKREGVAEVFNIGRGRVGFISSLSQPFCESCSRIRLSAFGVLRPCLFSEEGISIREYLGDGLEFNGIVKAFARALAIKPQNHGIDRTIFERANNVEKIKNIRLKAWENPMIYNIGG